MMRQKMEGPAEAGRISDAKAIQSNAFQPLPARTPQIIHSPQIAVNLGQATSFGPDAAFTAMQSAIGELMRAQGMKQETAKYAASTRRCAGDSDARLACKQENDVLRESVVGRSRRLTRNPARRQLPPLRRQDLVCFSTALSAW
ncbi:hypothetical protein R69888_03572 [Paraburkholderia haematera]|uniref:Uncharacterized protein n=1 Tax=Paraburkholderia haematera TaxID=2793077 RepID=A0ABM8RPG2_9BURK|nr:hypothetical protein R69888_03572 [Paraburkholderia haematera]